MQTSFIRHYHASKIFHAIRLSPGISQREIARKTNADKSTISAVVKTFESAGLVERTLRVSESKPGRPGEGLRLSSNGGLLVGVLIKPQAIDYIISGLDGVVLMHRKGDMPPSPEAVAESIGAEVTACCIAMGRSLSDVYAIGVSVPGLITMEGTIAQSPNLGWRDVPLLAMLRRAISVPVFLDNDANGAALAESLFGSGIGHENFVYLESGSGVGAGLVLDGSIFRGLAGFGGELGHTKIVPKGRLCHCGSKGCLSAYVADWGIIKSAEEAGVGTATVAELAKLADEGDGKALAVFNDAATYLGMGLSNIINTLNPGVVILGGSLARYSRYFLDPIKSILSELTLRPLLEVCKIEASSLNEDDTFLGATAIALHGCTSLDALETTPWRIEGDPAAQVG